MRKLIKALLVLALSAACGTAPAQTPAWPSRTVRVLNVARHSRTTRSESSFRGNDLNPFSEAMA